MADFKQTMRKCLRVRMAEMDMSAEQLAAASGVSIDAIRQYLRGDTAPLFETACKLSGALHCTPNDLCGITKTV